jgi:hypothetical protein
MGMAEKEVRRRFRLVAIGYMIFAAFVVAGVWINYAQTQDIKRNAEAIKLTTKKLFARDCRVVVSTAGVFVDFIKEEIRLREVRAKDPNASKAVRAFDRAEVNYWKKRTLPEIAQVFRINCTPPK